MPYHLYFVLGLICGILIAYAITTGERRDTRDELRRLRAIVAGLQPDDEGTRPIPGRRHNRRQA